MLHKLLSDQKAWKQADDTVWMIAMWVDARISYPNCASAVQTNFQIQQSLNKNNPDFTVHGKLDYYCLFLNSETELINYF